MTPLRIVFGLSWPIALRRLLGLFAFFYACLHFSVWLVLDHFFDWREMGADIVKRPYITVGMTALCLMLPLAATSTARAIKRLGGKNWQRLHRLAYVIGVCGVLHYLWLAKKANPAPVLLRGSARAAARDSGWRVGTRGRKAAPQRPTPGGRRRPRHRFAGEAEPGGRALVALGPDRRRGYLPGV